MRKKTKLIGFMNAYSQGKSGGDMVFIEIVRRLRGFDKVIVTSSLGKKLCQDKGIAGEYLITTTEREFRHVILTYIIRTLKVLFLRLPIKTDDILLSSSDFLPDVLPAFWLKLNKPKSKWIQHIFHLIPSSRIISSLAQKISFLFIKQLADGIVVDNSLLKKDLKKLGFGPAKIIVNHPGVNLSYLRSIKILDGKAFDGIFMAQLRLTKGIFDLIKIWKIVCQKRANSCLGIIGKGNRKIVSRLKTEIKKYHLERNIHILGYLADDEAFSTIKRSKLFIFPSYEEGFGIAPLEAQALGLPVVAWNSPVFNEIFPKGMIKIKTGNIKSFSKEILNLLIDDSYYQQLSKAAIDNAGRYDWNKVVKTELEIIEGAVIA